MESIDLFGDVSETKPISENILEYLNEKKPSKIPYKKTHSNLKDIEARIKEQFKVDDFKIVIDYKIQEWKDNLKMKKYIRPSTLFGTKFNQYLVEAVDFRKANDGSKNFEYNPQKKAQML